MKAQIKEGTLWTKPKGSSCPATHRRARRGIIWVSNSELIKEIELYLVTNIMSNVYHKELDLFNDLTEKHSANFNTCCLSRTSTYQKMFTFNSF